MQVGDVVASIEEVGFCTTLTIVEKITWFEERVEFGGYLGLCVGVFGPLAMMVRATC